MAATSTLNPNAPIFVPLAYREVEDFSDLWWNLVHSSPWFCHYWLQEYSTESHHTPDSQVDDQQPPFPHIHNPDDFPHDGGAFFDNISNPARKG